MVGASAKAGGGARYEGGVLGGTRRRVEVVYVGSDGVRRQEPLALCWSFPFERAGAVRRFTSRQGRRSFSGLWYFASTGDHVGYESWVERDRLMALDAGNLRLAGSLQRALRTSSTCVA